MLKNSINKKSNISFPKRMQRSEIVSIQSEKLQIKTVFLIKWWICMHIAQLKQKCFFALCDPRNTKENISAMHAEIILACFIWAWKPKEQMQRVFFRVWLTSNRNVFSYSNTAHSLCHFTILKLSTALHLLFHGFDLARSWTLRTPVTIYMIGVADGNSSRWHQEVWIHFKVK